MIAIPTFRGCLNVVPSGGYDPDAQAWFDAVVAAGSSISSANKTAWDTCVKGLKADGVWSLIAEIYVLCGPDSLAGALVKAKGSGSLTNFNFVSGDYGRTTGLQGNGSTKYLRTGKLTNTLSNTSNGLFFNGSSLETSGIRTVIGCWNNSSAQSILTMETYTSAYAAREFRSGTYTVGQFPQISSSLITSGSLFGCRRSSSDCALYQNGSPSNSNATPVTPVFAAVELYIFALNNTVAPSQYSSSLGRVAAVTEGLTDAQAFSLHNRIATYISALT